MEVLWRLATRTICNCGGELQGKVRNASPASLTVGFDVLSGNFAAVRLVELYCLLPEEEYVVKSLYFCV